MTASVTHRKTDLHPSLLLLNLECPRVPGKPERRGGSGSFRKAQEGPALVSLLHVLRLGPWDPTIFHGCLVWRVELVGDNGGEQSPPSMMRCPCGPSPTGEAGKGKLAVVLGFLTLGKVEMVTSGQPAMDGHALPES